MKTAHLYRLAAIAFILVSAAAAQKPATHPAAEDRNHCAACHVDPAPTKVSWELRSDIDSSCIGCHTREKENHRTGIVPTFAVPADLVLGHDGKLSCVTCHDPHTPRWSSRPWQAQSLAGSMRTMFAKRHPTYFLRRNNAHGDLCLSCHRALEEKKP